MIVCRIFTGIFLLCCWSITLDAQSTEVCYERFIKEGLEAQKELQYDLAIYKFEAANICPDKPLENEVDDLLEAANEAKINALTEARDRAEKSEQIAEELFAVSESSRLAILANRELDKVNMKGALKLAYRAMQIVGEQEAPAKVQRTFANAVFRLTLKKLEGHNQPVYATEFSSDGQLILTVSKDTTIIVWTNNGEQVMQLRGFEAEIQSAHFSPDGKHILVACGHEAQLWNLQEQRMQTLGIHRGLVYEAVFSSDGRLAASCSRDQTINIWNLKTGEPIAYCKGYDAAVTQVQFSKDNSKLLGLSADKSIRIWDAEGQFIQKITHKDLYFAGAAFGPQEGQLLTFTVDKAMQIWDIDSRQLLSEIKGHRRSIRQVVMPPNAGGFLSYAADSLAIFWNADGVEQFRIEDRLTDRDRIIYSDDGNFILSYAERGIINLFNKEGQLLMGSHSLAGIVREVDISPDNRWLVGAGGSILYAQLFQNPYTYYLQLKKNPPEDFTKEEKEKYAIVDLFK